MPPVRDEETTDETVKLREQIAYQQGRRDADVDGALNSHRRWLLRHDDALKGQGEKLEAMDGKLDQLITEVTSGKAVDADRDTRYKRELTRLQTVAVAIGVPTAIAVPILSAFIAAGKIG